MGMALRTLPFHLRLTCASLAAFATMAFTSSLSGIAQAQASEVADTERAHFPVCVGSGRITCIVDGDTIWYRGTKIRIADIDTPEVSRPSCPREARLGGEATARMQALLSAGPFSLGPSADGRTSDHYGRALQVVTRNGQSLGMALVREGLAEEWGGPRINWC